MQRLTVVYEQLRAVFQQIKSLEAMRGVYHGSVLLYLGHTLNEARMEAAKPDDEREDAYRTRNYGYLLQRMTKRCADLHPPHECALVSDALAAAEAVGFDLGLAPIQSLVSAAMTTTSDDAAGGNGGGGGAVSRFLFIAPPQQEEGLKEYVAGLLADPAAESVVSDPFVAVASILFDDYVRLRDHQKTLLSERDVRPHIYQLDCWLIRHCRKEALK